MLVLPFGFGNVLSRPPQRDEKLKSSLDFVVRSQWANPCDLERFGTVVKDNFYNLTGLEGEIASHFKLKLAVDNRYFVIDLLALGLHGHLHGKCRENQMWSFHCLPPARNRGWVQEAR
jgi:hypothetical protein